jgi:hypothetical protein
MYIAYSSKQERNDCAPFARPTPAMTAAIQQQQKHKQNVNAPCWNRNSKIDAVCFVNRYFKRSSTVTYMNISACWMMVSPETGQGNKPMSMCQK